MPDLNPYEVLHLVPGATHEEIRAAYRRASRATHPDLGGNSHAFHQVQLAFAALTSGPGGVAPARRERAATAPQHATPTSGGTKRRGLLRWRRPAAKTRRGRDDQVPQELYLLLSGDGREGEALRILEATVVGPGTIIAGHHPRSGTTVHRHVSGHWERGTWVLVDDLGTVLRSVSPRTS